MASENAAEDAEGADAGVVEGDLFRIADDRLVQLDDVGVVRTVLVAGAVTADDDVLGHAPRWGPIVARDWWPARPLDLRVVPTTNPAAGSRKRRRPLRPRPALPPRRRRAHRPAVLRERKPDVARLAEPWPRISGPATSGSCRTSSPTLPSPDPATARSAPAPYRPPSGRRSASSACRRSPRSRVYLERAGPRRPRPPSQRCRRRTGRHAAGPREADGPALDPTRSIRAATTDRESGYRSSANRMNPVFIGKTRDLDGSEEAGIRLAQLETAGVPAGGKPADTASVAHAVDVGA